MVEPTGPVFSQLYRERRESLTPFVAGLAPEAWDLPVAACPAWTVHDVVAHVSGIVDDALNGRLDGVATDPWTARQVEAGASMTVPELLGRWSEQAPQFEALPLPFRAAVDLACHEQDIRNAVGQPGERDNRTIEFAIGVFLDDLVQTWSGKGLGPITIRTDADAVIAGADHSGPPVTLTTTRYELFRARLGRRSRAQVLAMGWSGGDPAPYLDHFFAFGPAAQDVLE